LAEVQADVRQHGSQRVDGAEHGTQAGGAVAAPG
jgi:hypothetical protein